MAGGVVLIGFMGAGKSTVGRLLATRMGLEFADTDDLVIADAGRSIAEIWESEGEDGFRAREAEAVAKATATANCVIATGGGAVLSERNVERLRAVGPIVALHVSAATLEARVGDGESRPLLAEVGAAGRADLLSSRAAIYEAVSDHQVMTDDKDPATIVEEIMEVLR